MQIFGPSITRNSAFALACTPRLVDPMLFVYLMRCTPDMATKFLTIASRARGLAHLCGGPASCLKFYLLKLGRTISPTGDFHVGPFLSLSLPKQSFQLISRKARQAWQEHLLLFYSD